MLKGLFISTLMIVITVGCSASKEVSDGEETGYDDTATVDTGDNTTGVDTDTDHTGDDTGAVDTGTNTVDLEFQPVQGDWSYLTEIVTVDTCNMGAETLEARVRENAVLTVSELVDISLLHRQGEEACVLDEKSFSCGARAELDRTPEDYGLDAVMSLDFVTSGLFINSEEMNFDIDVTVDCTGDDCWIIEMSLGTEMPCVMEIDSELTAGY